MASSEIFMETNDMEYTADDWTFQDPHGNGIRVLNQDGTKVSLTVAYGMVWDKERNKWKPMFHTGLLFTGQFESATECEEYKFCLAHAVPTRDGIKLEMHLSNSSVELTRILGNFVESNGWQDYIKHFGTSFHSVSGLAESVAPILNLEFKMSDIRERIRRRQKSLLPETCTNCIDACCRMLRAMDFEASVNDLTVLLLAKCYKRVGDMNLKYGMSDDKWNAFVSDISDVTALVVYNEGISRQIKTEIKEVIRMALTREPSDDHCRSLRSLLQLL